MDTCIINPQRGKHEPHLPPVGVFAVNPSDAALFPQLAKQFHLKSHFLFHSKLYSSEQFFLAGPAVGAPMAVMCLEKIIALGARHIIVYGWCGALSAKLSIGDVFIPISGVSEEGTSKHYHGETSFPPDKQLVSRICSLLTESDIQLKKGPIWTTDAPYRETKKKVEQLGERGIMGVDMEYTALASVAVFRQAALCSVMLVSDELYHDQWKEQVSRKSFRASSKKMLTMLCTKIYTEDVVC